MVKQKNILFISSWYPNTNDPTLGIFVKRHAIAASLYNNVCILFAKSDASISETQISTSEFNGIKEIIISYPAVQNRTPVYSTYLKAKKLISNYNSGLDILKKDNFIPDIVHCNVMDPVGIVALKWKKKKNIPYVVTEHWTGYTDLDGRYKNSRKLQSYIPSIANNASWILPVSSDLENALVRKKLGKRHKVIRNVVDTDNFLCEEINQNQFMVIADLENDQKNIKGILSAFKVFSSSNPTIQLTIAGGGNDEISIKKKISELELTSKVRLVGRIPAQKLSEELNKSFALILFSNYENLPCVIVESFACGIPVISTNVGGIQEIINETNGILIQPKQEQQLTEAMSTVLQKKWNRKTIRQFAVENFSLDTIGKEFNEIYQQI